MLKTGTVLYDRCKHRYGRISGRYQYEDAGTCQVLYILYTILWYDGALCSGSPTLDQASVVEDYHILNHFDIII